MSLRAARARLARARSKVASRAQRLASKAGPAEDGLDAAHRGNSLGLGLSDGVIARSSRGADARGLQAPAPERDRGVHLLADVVRFVASTSRGGQKRPHRLHGCARVPGVCHLDYGCPGEEMLDRHHDDDLCRDCWRLSLAGASAASSPAPSTCSSPLRPG